MKVIESESEEGLIIGLIDSILSTSSIARNLLYKYKERIDRKRDDDDYFEICGRHGYGEEIEAALENLQQHQPLYLLLQQIGYNPNILSEADRKMMDRIEKTVNLLKTKNNIS